MSPLEKRIDYKFRNPLLLAEALTHSSVRHKTADGHFDNQRLEFLGDAVLELIITDHLFKRFPSYTEGQLTQLRSRLVSRSGLASLAERIELSRYLLIGRGEEASGGRERASIVADAFEGLVGALYLDSDLETVSEFVLGEAKDALAECEESLEDHNPKGCLQELLQGISAVSPVYEVVSESGPEHKKEFVSRVVWESCELGVGEGPSKKLAEVAAARVALERELWKTAKRGEVTKAD